MSWGDYGFPDITMMSPLIPTNGIRAALKERFPTGYAFDNLDPYEVMKSRSSTPSRMMYLHNYINQFLDMNAHPDHIFWDYWDMKAEIEQRVPSGESCILNDGSVIGGTPSHPVVPLNLLPDWPAMIARQQYLNANLLKIKHVPAFIRMGTGMTSGSYSTVEAAYQSAVDDFHEDFSIFRAWDGTFETIIQGRPGSYSCIIHRPIEIRPDYTHYPGLEGLPSRLYFRAAPWSYNYTIFDAHGMNVLYSRERFSAIPLPYYSLTPAHPDNLPSSTDGSPVHLGYDCFGYDSNGPYYICGVDVSSLFEFYENVD